MRNTSITLLDKSRQILWHYFMSHTTHEADCLRISRRRNKQRQYVDLETRVIKGYGSDVWLLLRNCSDVILYSIYCK